MVSKILGFHLKLRKITSFMSNLAYLSMLKPPKREEPKTSKGPSRTRRESPVDFGAFFAAEKRQSFVAFLEPNPRHRKDEISIGRNFASLGGGVFPLNLSLSKWRSVQGD